MALKTTKNYMAIMGGNFWKEVQSIFAWYVYLILGMINKLKLSGFLFHTVWITITKFQGNLRGSPWKLLKIR